MGRPILLLAFAILFGSTAQASEELRSFPTERDVLPSWWARWCLRRARADFDLLRAGKLPRYAKSTGALYDGGTNFYQGRGYKLIWHHSIEGDPLRKPPLFFQGPSIQFSTPIMSDQRGAYYGETRVAPDPARRAATSN